jgi:uncharacterized membrane protein
MEGLPIPLAGFLDLPIHPPFVHFPVALLSISWVSLVIAHATGSAAVARFAGTAEWVGLAFVPVTLVTGLADVGDTTFVTQIDWTQPLIWHAILSTAAVALFALHAVRRTFWRSGSLKPATALALSGTAFWLLTIAGLVAGEMVYG